MTKLYSIFKERDCAILINCTDTDVDYDTPITKFDVSLLFILRYSYETEVEV